MLTNFFRNYEVLKLPILSPTFNYLLIIGIFIILSILSIRRTDSTQLLDKDQTNQLKGIGIIFVITHHLWTHVSENLPILLLSGGPVFLFLLLSGFGLTLSLKKQVLSFKDYFKRRILSIMIPYWIATIIILLLDYTLLEKNYLYKDIIATFAGINISLSTQYIDYVRWYITFQLFYYIIFFIFNKYLPFLKTISLLIIYIIISLAFSRITGLGTGFELAFPIGCIIGKHYGKIQDIFMQKTKLFMVSAIIILILFFAYKYVNIYVYFNSLEFSNTIAKAVRYVSLKGISNIFSLFFCFSFIIFIGFLGKGKYVSRFLTFCGTITYELFLLHGCFLIKNNFIFPLFDIKLISLSFFVYFVILIFISILFKKIINHLLILF